MMDQAIAAPPLRVLYFAWLRDRLGRSEERLALPAGVADVGALRGWMRGRDPLFAELFADGGRIRAAVNQDFADDAAALSPGDEVAFFPPVTGG